METEIPSYLDYIERQTDFILYFTRVTSHRARRTSRDSSVSKNLFPLEGNENDDGLFLIRLY